MESLSYFADQNAVIIDAKTKKECEAIANAFLALSQMEMSDKQYDDASYHLGMYVELIKLSEQIKEEE